MAVLSLIYGLVRGSNAPKTAKHELFEVTSVAISCGHMDRSYSYSFWANKEENRWWLNAECFTYDYEVETKLEKCELANEDAETLLEILEQNESIAYIENERKSKKYSNQAADDTAYSFCLTFSDGDQYVSDGRQSDLEKFFYCLAEKYDEK